MMARPTFPSNKMSRKLIAFLTITFCIPITNDLLGADDQPTDSQQQEIERLFATELLPILNSKCLGCHGSDPDDLKGEFSVTTRDAVLYGGESGLPGVVPGKPQESSLLEAIAWEGLEMPPKENDRLTAKQVQQFAKWIEAGAPWPKETVIAKYQHEAQTAAENEAGRIVATSGGLSDEWTFRRYLPEDLWAFQPIADTHAILRENETPSAVIDSLVDQKLEEAGLQKSDRATPRELIRRAYFDLTGLPPTPAEIKVFESESKVDPNSAWVRLVDRLLQSPRYGEHAARFWFDVTRYSDTGGMSNDFERSNMWRYRDYVIRSFNSDKPYNEFIIEQLAGDELADQSVLRRTNQQSAVSAAQLDGNYNAQESEWIVATGFLRIGPWDNAMIESEEARQIYLDDLVNITGQTFLSQTLRCCKCHDHKFDPIPTRDYYRIYATFSTTQMAERNVPFIDEESQERFEEGRQHVQRMLDYAVAEKNRLITKRETAARAWFEERQLPYLSLEKRKDLPDEEKPPRHVGLSFAEQGQLKVREQDEWIWTRRLERYEPMAQSVYNAAETKLAWNGARKLRIDRKAQTTQVADTSVPKSFILIGGALTARGVSVVPGALSAISIPMIGEDEYQSIIPSSVSGRRLALAEWIANPQNPLTTRSISNRIWQWHFGKGIAANSNNLGAKGASPTHPELLDFLATQLIENDWSIKDLHRTIMLSESYQRSSHAVDQVAATEVDPNNSLLSHFPRRRLRAEELRDSCLAVSGELINSSGGLPVFPEINMEVALQPRMIQFSLAPAYQPSATPDERNRRSVYAYQVRGQIDPFAELFNQPNPNESCELRETSAVTTQAFSLLNSDLMTDRSIAFATRLQSEFNERDQQIRRGFELAFGREPSEIELKRMLKYVADMEEYHRANAPSEVEYPTSITRSLVEEFSGERFEYEEILPMFERYQPDRKASDVSFETRALADFCLLLFNANEFMYIE